jgi:hypothetical protein
MTLIDLSHSISNDGKFPALISVNISKKNPYILPLLLISVVMEAKKARFREFVTRQKIQSKRGKWLKFSLCSNTPISAIFLQHKQQNKIRTATDERTYLS